MTRLDTEQTDITKEVDKCVEGRLVYHVFNGNVNASLTLVKNVIADTLGRLIQKGCIDPITLLPVDTEVPPNLNQFRKVEAFTEKEDLRIYHFTYWYQKDNERKMGSLEVDTAFWDTDR